MSEDIKKHTFNRGVDTILGECIAISDQRGGEYADTWDLKNINTPATGHVLRMKGTFNGEDEMLDKRWRRLLVMAALIDVKLSRLLGEYKEDTFIDLINYSACFADLMRDWKKNIKAGPDPAYGASPLATSKYAGKLPFSADVLADLREESDLRASYEDHYHEGENVYYVNGDTCDDDDGLNVILARRHMSANHRQDGTPVIGHMPRHASQPLQHKNEAHLYSKSDYF